MCTVTWLRTVEGYELFSNRDELRTRPPARPPRAGEAGGARFLAPEDGEAGGSWITVNEHGLSLGLLNLYQARLSLAPARPDGSPFTSRGLLVQRLAAARSCGELLGWIRGFDLQAFRPFTLLALAPAEEGGGVEVRAVEWDGEGFTDLGADPPQPLISSGYDFTGAARHRRASFEAFLARLGGRPPGREDLALYHRGHQPERGPYSVCMHRPDARTVSFTWVSVRREEVVMAYAPGPPCTTPLGEPVSLARAGVAALG